MEPEHDLFAIHVQNDPSSGLESLVEAGFIVRTRADGFPAPDDTETRRQRALESGAQVVTTDFTVEQGGISAFQIPGGTPSRCNPLTAGAGCESTDVELLTGE